MAITLDGTSGITTPGIVGNLSVSGNTTVGGTLTNTGLITASAGVAIGGVGAANTLDDYEEGTWTMALSDGTNSAGSATGYYTKIGNMVFVRGSISNVNTSALTNTSNDLIITGLPFATSSSKNGNQRTSGTVSVDQVSFNGYLTCETGFGSNTELRLLENNSGSSGDRILVSQYTSGSSDIWLEVTYPTEA